MSHMECPEGIEGVHEHCCLHDLPASDEHAPGQVCCWCGGVYLHRESETTDHGPYIPRVFKPRKKKRK